MCAAAETDTSNGSPNSQTVELAELSGVRLRALAMGNPTTTLNPMGVEPKDHIVVVCCRREVVAFYARRHFSVIWAFDGGAYLLSVADLPSPLEKENIYELRLD